MVAIEVGSNQEPRVLTGAITHEGGNDLTGCTGEVVGEVQRRVTGGFVSQASEIDVVLAGREIGDLIQTVKDP